MLAGDSLRAAADLKLPMIAVTLAHRRGYFYQRLDAEGVQAEEPVDWALDDYLKPLEPRVAVTLEGRPVKIAAWQFDIVGVAGFTVPVVLLDTDLPENVEGDRATHRFRCTAATPATDCSRRSCWEWAVCACSGHWALATYSAIT